MKLNGVTASAARVLLLALLLLAPTPGRLWAAGDPAQPLLRDTCGTGWKMEGKASFYDRETLSDRIDGEAELYFPYGFERMTAGRYASAQAPGAGMDLEIFAMGSLLDAFGMYANYRQKEGRTLGIGAESNLAGSQLFFYQGRYFVHLQVTGSDLPDPEPLSACGRAVAARLGGTTERPAELAVFDRAELVQGSERYLPESLLGYDFLNRGILADADVGGAKLQVFLLLGTSAESASVALERYRSQMSSGRVEAGGKDAQFLEGVDPLYGAVTVLRKGKCLAGALKYSDKKGVRGFLESLCR